MESYSSRFWVGLCPETLEPLSPKARSNGSSTYRGLGRKDLESDEFPFEGAARLCQGRLDDLAQG